MIIKINHGTIASIGDTMFLEKFFIYRVFRKLYRYYYWRKNNRHNHIILKNVHNYKDVIAGKHSYGNIDALFSSTTGEKLYIGNFCSISQNVLFIVSSEHNYQNLSTYPFKSLILKEGLEALAKGDIVVKDDVWIGANVTVLSGVTINQGAIVAAGSIVTKDVPPYAIVGGNPARIIKYRFSENIRQKMLKIDYSKLTDKKIINNIETLYTKITEENVDKIIEKLSI